MATVIRLIRKQATKDYRLASTALMSADPSKNPIA